MWQLIKIIELKMANQLEKIKYKFKYNFHVFWKIKMYMKSDEVFFYPDTDS